VAFSPDGQTVITGSGDWDKKIGEARLWSAATGQELTPPLRHRGPVSAVAFSPDGQAVITGSGDGTARLWSAGTGQALTPPLRHQGPVDAVAFGPDGRAVLTGSGDETARLWSAATGQALTPPLNHRGGVNAVAFSSDGKTVLTGSGDHTARLWSAATDQALTPPLAHQGDVNAVAFSPDGKAVLTGSTDKTARLWSAATGQALSPPLRHEAEVLAVAFSPDGKAVLTGSGYGETGEARLWSAATGKALTPPLRHESLVWAVAFSPDGKAVLTGSHDHTARLWSAATGHPLTPPLRHQGGVIKVAFSPDGQVVLTAGGGDGEAGEARLWSAATGQALTPPLRHQRRVIAATFSPDGKAVLTGSSDWTARLWSAATGKELIPPLRHQGTVSSVAFSPDGKTVLTGSGDGTARLWRMPAAAKRDGKLTKLWTQVRSGTEMDEHGGLRILDAQTWQQRRKDLKQLEGKRIPKEQDALVWHRREALEAEIAGQWLAMAWHLSHLIDKAPNDWQLWHGRATAYGNLGQLEKASHDLTRACALPQASPAAWSQHALLRQYLGDARGYRRACATLVKRWDSETDPNICIMIGWTCVLGPDAIPDLGPVLEIAEIEVQIGKEIASTNSRPLTRLGAILFRAGRHEEAVKRFQQAVMKSPEKRGSTLDWLFLAMAQQKLGQGEEAKNCLAKAEEFLNAKSRPWDQQLMLKMLHREAKSLLKQ
jgi:WD40 repeat protein/Flp pilus assembly protein TadD